MKPLMKLGCIFFQACTVGLVFAGTLQFLPQSATQIELPLDSKVFVQYLLINKTDQAMQLQLSPLSGVTQRFEGQHDCPKEIKLAPSHSCLLALEVAAADLSGNPQKDLKVCQESHCFRPQEKGLLRLQVVGSDKAMLSVRPQSKAKAIYPIPKGFVFSAPLPTCPVPIISNAGVPRVFVVTNSSSTVTARNVQIRGLPAGVTQTPDPACASIPPGGSCNINLFSVIPTASFSVSISGSNTTSVSFMLEVQGPLSTGQSWKGGVIYSINPNNVSGALRASAFNSTAIPWDVCVTPFAPIARGLHDAGPSTNKLRPRLPLCADTFALSNNDGRANTNTIIAALNSTLPLSSYAAGICRLYSVSDPACGVTYSDWYLPAINQLSSLISADSGFFTGILYTWSSTEVNLGEAYSMDDTLFSNSRIKGLNSHVVCIRDFTY